MSRHVRSESRLRRRLLSPRLRALLGLGVLLGVGVTGTFAFWSDDVTIAGTTLTAGTLDLQVNNSDAPSTTTLGMTAMVPGNTSAEVLTIKNNGTAPLKYTLTGGLTGTDAAAFHAAAALRLTVVASGTKLGTGNSSTCPGGTVIYGPAALTNVTSTAIIGTRRGPRTTGTTESLCFQVTFDSGAPTTLQGKTATATFTATGASDVS